MLYKCPVFALSVAGLSDIFQIYPTEGKLDENIHTCGGAAQPSDQVQPENPKRRDQGE